MIPILLLAGNFVRQNRWLLLAFMLWPFMLGAFSWSPHHAANREDVAENVRVEVFYGTAVLAFLTSSGIYNERRSRRIIGVLSKSVSRLQYLLGLWIGASCFAVLYFLTTSVSVIWLLRSSEVQFAIVVLLRGLGASLWVSAAALLFSTFLYPFFAAILAGGAAFGPLALSHPSAILTPVALLVWDADSFTASIHWTAFASALAESVLLLILAAQIFAYRDVTVTIE